MILTGQPNATVLQRTSTNKQQNQECLTSTFAQLSFLMAAQPKMDFHIPKDTFVYAITISPKDDYDQKDQEIVIDWHSRFEQTLLVKEIRPQDGVKHYHSLVVSPVKKAQALTRQLERLYTKAGMDFVKGVTFRVKTCVEPIGWFQYLLKDMSEDQKPLGLKGFKMSWIKSLILANLKKMPHQLLLKDVYAITAKTGTRIVIEYARRKSLTLNDKFSFADVVSDMMSEGYQFDNVRIKYCYAQVMAASGCKRKAASVILADLNFVD